MVKFETKFNREVTDTINKSQMKNAKLIYVVSTIAFIIIGAFFILESIKKTDIFSIVIGSFLVLFGIFFKPLCVLLTKSTQKKLDKTMSILSDNTLANYSFYEDKIIINTENEGLYKSCIEASYEYIFKVVEETDSFILYISKMQCHVVMKRDLVEGTLEEMQGYLRANFDTVQIKGTSVIYSRINN